MFCILGIDSSVITSFAQQLTKNPLTVSHPKVDNTNLQEHDFMFVFSFVYFQSSI